MIGQFPAGEPQFVSAFFQLVRQGHFHGGLFIRDESGEVPFPDFRSVDFEQLDLQLFFRQQAFQFDFARHRGRIESVGHRHF